jgi:hypothetical protein
MSKLTDAARGQECKVRCPGYCNFNPETTVAAHIRMAGITGVGMKAIDILSAHACSACHDILDGRIKTAFTQDELRLMHFEGMARTIEWAFKRGLLK